MFNSAIFFSYVWPPTAFANPLIREGFLFTVTVAVLAEAIAVFIGVLVALARTSRNAILSYLAAAHVTFFRGTPMIVWLALLYFGTASAGLYRFPDIVIGGFAISGVAQAAVLGLGIHTSAFSAEIMRAGLNSIPRGQIEAARALGLRSLLIFRKIIFPQMLRVVLPPLGNEFNSMLKMTTLTIVVGAKDFFNAFEQINARIFAPFELFLAAACYYVVLTIVFDILQRRFEARLNAPYIR